MLKKRPKHKANQGQATIEGMAVIGLILVPLVIAALQWVNVEWKKSEKAFQDFKQARITMIRTQRKSDVNGIVIMPLEDLDQDKGGLGLQDLINEASQLLGLLSQS